MAKSKFSATETVSKYYHTKEKYDAMVEKFNNIKKDFYKQMEKEFGNDTKLLFQNFGESFEVTKVKKSTVTFDIGKLERSLSKEILKQIIVKHYQVSNFDGLLAYLKSLGADPNKVKEYIVSTKDIDTKKVDKLSELGMIDDNKIYEASTTVSSEPYYKVKKL